MIEAEGLTKRLGENLAVDGMDLAVPRGSILGLLGPNGAGKTTTVRILTTLLRPDSGWGRVGGYDVVSEAAAARSSMGVTAQGVTVDEMLTGRQNLVMIGRLSGLRRRDAQQVADGLLTQFDLTDAATRPVRTYSGGMRRRLDLTAGLVTRPHVIFLDEPTTGLDPHSRSHMWEVIRSLVADGVTLLLTTQYLDEADELADQIIVMNRGRAVASGTPVELKKRIGGAHLEVHLTRPEPAAIGLVAPHVLGEVDVSRDGTHLRAAVDSGVGLATTIVRELDTAGITVDDIAVQQPSLDDVFFALTGHAPEPTVNDPERVLSSSDAHREAAHP